MPSKINAYLLSAVMLAALVQCAHGAPLQDAPTDSPAGDPSGEEDEETSADTLGDRLHDAAVATKRQQSALENEFSGQVKFHHLERYKVSSLPEKCPRSNFSKEACLQRLAQGVLTYKVLLKHVEKEYPGTSTPSQAMEIRGFLNSLYSVIIEKMRDPGQVTALTSVQEEQLLRDIESPDAFHRKMTALSIISNLYEFLTDGKRKTRTRQRHRRSMTDGGMTPISFYY